MVDSPLVNVQDSVVMGDVNYNTVHNHVLECPNCGMQGVPVIRCSKNNCANRFCHQCEKRWVSFRTRDQLPVCQSCFEQEKEEKEAAALALGVTPLSVGMKAKFSTPETDPVFKSTLPVNIQEQKTWKRADEISKEEKDKSLSLLIRFTIVACCGVLLGMFTFLLT
tara:strand:- start:1 stop:498 length:498 start_codon:yes stop_codon:yes gene_type:complete